jgi:O-succinylbenzoic acid--CoA ligase
VDTGVDFLALGVAAAPDGVALSDPDTRWTYRELDALVTERAQALMGSGLVPGSVVAATLGCDAPSVIAVHAIRRAGLRLTPLHPGWTETERTRAARGAGAIRILDPLEWPDPTAATAESVAREDVPSTGHAAPQLPGRLPNDWAVVWTSGTGGRPRGVTVAASALLHIARASATRLQLGPGDAWYASLQPAHVGGLALVVRAAALGSEVVATGGFDAVELASLVGRGRVTHASLVPVMLRRFLDRLERMETPPSRGRRSVTTLRAVLVGGAHTPPDLVRRALDLSVPLALTWGMTEASSQVATATPAQVESEPRSVGRPLDGVEVAVQPSGELWVRGPTVSPGYVTDLGDLADADGWYHTGDLGHRDEAGFLYVTGRVTDRIISGGLNVDPREVEAVIRSLPDVVDCAVVGLPDPEWGERVAAAVVPRAGAELTPDALSREQAPHLASGKQVRAWLVLESLPLNANGKVDRDAIRSRFVEGPEDRGTGADVDR